MQGSDLEAQIRAELEAIMPLVSHLTGLPARWSGRVELVAEADFKGKKRFSCDIQLDVALASQETRWTTLIHESLHAVSSGYTQMGYQNLRGWEEGVVEKMQRLLRQDILNEIGITLPAETLTRLDAGHRYNRYIQALEAMRDVLTVSEVQFYRQLLAIPLVSRPTITLMQAYSLPAELRRDALEVISALDAALKMPF